MTEVPGKDGFDASLEGAAGQERVVDGAANDAQVREGLQRFGIFVRGERHNGQTFGDVADKEQGLVAADAMFTRHPREDGIDLEKAMRGAGNILFAETREHVQAGRMARVIAIEHRHQNRGI